jgi:hypothetical protein
LCCKTKLLINSNALLIVMGKLDCSLTHKSMVLIYFRHGDYGLRIGRLN